MSKSLLAFKTWSNSVVADDMHQVSLDGTILKLTRANDPEGTVLAELDMAEPVEDAPEAASAKKAPESSPKDSKK